MARDGSYDKALKQAQGELGSLLWIAIRSRPDITAAVGAMASQSAVDHDGQAGLESPRLGTRVLEELAGGGVGNTSQRVSESNTTRTYGATQMACSEAHACKRQSAWRVAGTANLACALKRVFTPASTENPTRPPRSAHLI